MSLYLIATPIGNLEDMTFRAVSTLQKADIILAEDTRRSRILLTHFNIEGKRTEAYHQHNEHARTPWVIDQVQKGLEVALVTDAGMPSIADPGFLLVREAVAAGIEPIVIPGVSAVTFAVTVCGFPVNRFRFLNFPPVKSGRRLQFLTDAVNSDDTAIFYEAPHRISKLIQELATVAPDRQVAIIREATKAHEEVIRGAAAELAEKYKDKIAWKGEFTIAVCGLAKHEHFDPVPFDASME